MPFTIQRRLNHPRSDWRRIIGGDYSGRQQIVMKGVAWHRLLTAPIPEHQRRRTLRDDGAPVAAERGVAARVGKPFVPIESERFVARRIGMTQHPYRLPRFLSEDVGTQRQLHAIQWIDAKSKHVGGGHACQHSGQQQRCDATSKRDPFAGRSDHRRRRRFTGGQCGRERVAAWQRRSNSECRGRTSRRVAVETPLNRPIDGRVERGHERGRDGRVAVLMLFDRNR